MENCMEVKKDLAEIIQRKTQWDASKAYSWLNSYNKNLGEAPDALIRKNQSKKVLEFIKTNSLQ